MRSLILTLTAGLAAAGILAAGEPMTRKKFYSDDPLWSMPRPAAVTGAKTRKLSEYYDFFENTLFAPGERASKSGVVLPSQGINTVDEVPDSAWYTNRHARRRMTLDELKRGAGDSHAPASGGWTVIAAKNEGITPGFRIKDSAGRQYIIKFDPISNPEMASAADVISSKFYHALGYNVPENYIVYFDRQQITVGSGSQLKDGAGKKRLLRPQDIDEMLSKTPRAADGKYRALASFIIPGKALGPFLYYGTRSDDPNDLIPHEHRRDLRGLRTVNAWLGHDDSKALNTLDVLVDADGIPCVKHYLIDFGATLGSATFEAGSPREGNTYLFDWRSSAAQFFSFGLYAPKWHHATYPRLPAAGRFEYQVFDPETWVPGYPNTAFLNETRADRLWAAKKIAAFTDQEIRAIVSTGQYTDPAAEEWVGRCLIARRNKIARAFLRGIPALDDFHVQNGWLEFRNASPTPIDIADIHVQWSVFENKTGARQPIADALSFRLPRVKGAGYLLASVTGPGAGSISIYVSLNAESPRVIGLERFFESK
jgi:hypothetical protein